MKNGQKPLIFEILNQVGTTIGPPCSSSSNQSIQKAHSTINLEK
jgi:hypothetical protein